MYGSGWIKYETLIEFMYLVVAEWPVRLKISLKLQYHKDAWINTIEINIKKINVDKKTH